MIHEPLLGKARAKLFLYEHPPGAGKTTEMINIINQAVKSGSKIVYAVPTKKLIDEIQESLSSKNINHSVVSEEVATTTVKQYLLDTELQEQVVLTTHRTVLMYPEFFRNRDLVIDELPTQVMKFDSFFTDKEDSHELEILTNSAGKLARVLKEHYNGSAKLHPKKVMFLESCLNARFAYERQEDRQNDRVWYHYASYTDPVIWENFDQIHLMAATIKNTMVLSYFETICGMTTEIPFKAEFQLRGNKLDNKTVIYPLTKFSNDRDFISKEVLEQHFDSMVNQVAKYELNDVITVANNDYKLALRKPLDVIPTYSHGLNAYISKTTAAIIYSANPNPYHIPFMKKCALALGLAENHFVDSYVEQNFYDVIFQAVTRTCIRNPHSTEECRFYVPDMRSAVWLQSKLDNATIDESRSTTIEIKEAGGQVGNTNALGNKGGGRKGCRVIKYLTDFMGLRNKKPYRIRDKFTEVNGIEPSMDIWEHKMMLNRVAHHKGRLDKFNFDLKSEEWASMKRPEHWEPYEAPC